MSKQQATFSPEDYLNANAWPFEEARKLKAHIDAKKAASIPDKGYVLFETGYGPSGLPHIGTFGEVFRTTVVRHAFQRLYPNLKTRLICFSDDMDGLRKVPTNVPNQDLLKQYLHKPLTRVPDPFEQFDSFAGHNNAMLRRFLDSFGFAYEFLSSTEQYTSGALNKGLQQVLEHHDAIANIVIPTLGEERAATYSPFLPVDEETGHVLQVPVIATNPAKSEITYRREDGKEITTSVLNGKCKLQWKPDWAMRWYVLDVDYEMCGKDLIDSVTLGNKICKELGGIPPLNLTYEHFVDENGAKISKSKGNGLTIDEWLRYAPPETLSLYMYRTPTRAKKLFRGLIPQTVEEYCEMLNNYPAQSSADKLDNPTFHIYNGAVPANPLPFAYGMLLNLVSVTAATEPTVVWNYIQRLRPDLTPQSQPQLTAIIEGAINFFNDTIKPTQTFHKPQGELELGALGKIEGYLKTLEGTPREKLDAEAIQTELYEIGKATYGKEKLRDFFKFTYTTLLGFPQGPRLGSFVQVYGVPETLGLITQSQSR